jgi:hypothetical protein
MRFSGGMMFLVSNLRKGKLNSQKMKNRITGEVNQEDERDCLSDSHRDYLIRYIEYELQRQEKVSKTFLQERLKPAVNEC